jgi:hypothetical protein
VLKDGLVTKSCYHLVKPRHCFNCFSLVCGNCYKTALPQLVAATHCLRREMEKPVYCKLKMKGQAFSNPPPHPLHPAAPAPHSTANSARNPPDFQPQRSLEWRRLYQLTPGPGGQGPTGQNGAVLTRPVFLLRRAKTDSRQRTSLFFSSKDCINIIADRG